MPYAPLAFSASYLQPLSLFQRLFRQPKYVLVLHPNEGIMSIAIRCADAGSV